MPIATVAETVEVVHRFGRGLGVVDVDARDAELRAELAAVDDRRAARRHRADERRGFLRQAMAEDDQAVGLLALQHQRVALFPLLVVLGVAEQHRIAVPLGRVFDALEDQREKRVRDVRNRDQQLAGAQRPQVLRG